MARSGPEWPKREPRQIPTNPLSCHRRPEICPDRRKREKVRGALSSNADLRQTYAVSYEENHCALIESIDDVHPKRMRAVELTIHTDPVRRTSDGYAPYSKLTPGRWIALVFL